MKITLKLNIGNYQSIDVESDDLPTKANCYEQICRVIKDWEDITDNATQLIGVFQAHIPDLEYPIEKLEVVEEVVKPKKLPTSNKKPETGAQEGVRKGKYTWYPLESGGKVRACNNAPCPYFLKFNEELGTYQHGKYDPETKVWGFIDDRCEFYGGG